MSKIDQKYIDALDTFTQALEQIVETLKEQQKNGSADVVNDFLKPSFDNLNNVVGDLKKTTQKGFAEIKSDNKKILEKIDSIRKERESGMFDKIEDSKNKNKIVDGIKVVILIAAGVLALGLAFKIIGKVDFLSVIALSAAIYVMSLTYSKIADIKNLKYSDVLKIAIFMPIMALGVALSSIILSKVRNISFQQGLSILFIGGSLGVASYMLLKAMHNISPKSILLAPFIPFLLPLIALGIVKSSEILPGIKSITLKTVIDVALVGIAIGVATFVISLALKHMKKITWKEMLMIPIMLPLIATGIVLSSKILKDFDPIRDPIKMLVGVAMIGLSILLFSPVIWLLSKLKTKEIIQGGLAAIAVSGVILATSWVLKDVVSINDPLKLLIDSISIGLSLLFFVPSILLLSKLSQKDTLQGGLAALAVSGVILATSWIFTLLPDNMKYPDIMWSLGAGLSLAAFGGIVTLLGLASAIPTFWIGFPALLAVAASVVVVSYILQAGKYDGNYPTKEWSTGVGLSLLAFAPTIVFLGAMGVLAGPALALGALLLFGVALAIVKVSEILGKGNYTGGPTKQWAEGVAISIGAFANALNVAMNSGKSVIQKIFGGGGVTPEQFVLFIETVSKGIVGAANLFNGVSWGSAPPVEWADGVGKSISAFSEALKVVNESGGLFRKNMSGKDFSDFIKYTAEGIIAAAKVFSKNVSYNNIPDEKYIKSLQNYVKNLKPIIKDWNIDIDDAIEFNQGITHVSAGLRNMSNIKPIPNNLSTGYTLFFNSLRNMPNLTSTDSKVKSIKSLTDRFAEMAETLGKVNINLQKFVDNYNRLDIKKLDKISDSVDKSAVSLGVKKPENDNGILGNILNGMSNLLKSNNKESTVITQNQSEIVNKKQEKFYDDISEIRRLLTEMRDDSNKPTKSGSFHK